MIINTYDLNDKYAFIPAETLDTINGYTLFIIILLKGTPIIVVTTTV